MNNYIYILEYIPVTTSNITSIQKVARNEVLDFMDGCSSRQLRETISSKVSEIAKGKENDCTIAFIPSWSKDRTVQRFSALSRDLTDSTRIEAYLDTLTLKQDGDPILMNKEMAVNSKRVKGKTVILVGGVYRTGKTFETACDLLKACGASDVIGIFAAKLVCLD